MGASRNAPTNIKTSGSKPTNLAELLTTGSKGQPIQASGKGGIFFGLPKAVAGMTPKGTATFSGDAFNKGEKETPKEDDFRTFKVSKDLDYEATKKRLLELAKEEAIKIGRSRDMEKEIYDRSLPDASDGDQRTAEMFLGKDYKKNVQKTIDNLPAAGRGMFGGGE